MGENVGFGGCFWGYFLDVCSDIQVVAILGVKKLVVFVFFFGVLRVFRGLRRGLCGQIFICVHLYVCVRVLWWKVDAHQRVGGGVVRVCGPVQVRGRLV